MQIFDRKYRLFGVINLIDLLVVVALIVAGLVVWKLLWGGSNTAVPVAKLQDVEYTIVCSLDARLLRGSDQGRGSRLDQDLRRDDRNGRVRDAATRLPATSSTPTPARSSGIEHGLPPTSTSG